MVLHLRRPGFESGLCFACSLRFCCHSAVAFAPDWPGQLRLEIIENNKPKLDRKYPMAPIELHKHRELVGWKVEPKQRLPTVKNKAREKNNTHTHTGPTKQVKRQFHQSKAKGRSKVKEFYMFRYHGHTRGTKASEIPRGHIFFLLSRGRRLSSLGSAPACVRLWDRL